jgi:LuxR family transcriptional regulator, maltose regulon positive regulatory protein
MRHLPPFNSVIATKYTPPPLSARYLPRALEAQAADGLARRLTFVQAPAGYGKTTLAVAALTGLAARRPTATVWLSLDRDDDDPHWLALQLISASAALLPAAAAAARAVAAEHPQAALQIVLNACQELPVETVFVLDDLQHLSSPAVHDLLATVIERSPRGVHWLLLSRHALPFAVSKLRLADDVLLIDSTALRWTTAETAAYLTQTAQLSLDDALLADLLQRTQGWIAGLQLTMLAWQAGAADPAQLPLFARADNRLLSDYLIDEVLARQPELLRTFLLDCALLEQLHPALCTAVTGRADSADLLEEAERRGLFIEPVTPHGDWYRLHALFREQLLARLRRRRGLPELQSAARRAADWLAAHDAIISALHCLLQVELHTEAVQLVSAHARRHLLAYRLIELQRWLQLIEPAWLLQAPALLIDRAWLQFMAGDHLALQATLTIANTVPAVAADPQLAVAYRLLAILQQIATSDLRAVFSGLLALTPQLTLHGDAFARGWSAYLQALCLQPDLAPQLNPTQLLAEARQLFAAAGAVFGTIYVQAAEVVLLKPAAPFEQLLGACRDGMVLAQLHPQLAAAREALQTCALYGGELLFYADRNAEARELFQLAYRDAQLIGNLLYLRQAALWLTLCGVVDGRPTPVLPEADSWLADPQLPQFRLGERAILIHLSALIAVRQRRTQTIAHLFALLRLDLSEVSAALPDHVISGILIAALLAGQPSTAVERQIDAVRGAVQQRGAVRLVLQLDLLQAVCLRRQGRHPAARTLLRRLLPAVATLHYERLLLFFPELLPLLRTIDHEIARRLVAVAEHDPQPDDVALVPQEERVLALLARRKTPAAIAEELVLAPSTVKWHVMRIYRKLGVHNRAEAVAWYTQRMAD